VRLVAAVQVDDHRGQPFEGASACERARIERAPGDELSRELERELLRRGIVSAHERVLVGRLREVRRRNRMQSCDDRRTHDVLHALGEAAGLRVREHAGALVELDCARDTE
jgi:hypothetical protein